MPREPYGSQIPPKPPKRKGAKTMANKPKTTKDGSPMKPKWMRDVKLDPLSTMVGRYAQSKRMTKQAQSISMDKVKKKRSTAADSKRKTGQAIDILGKKKAASNKTPKGFKRMGPVKKKQGR